MILMNIFIIILGAFFLRTSTSTGVVISVIFLSLFWALCVVGYIWIFRVKKIFYNGELTIDKLLYIITKGKKQSHLNLFSIDFKKVIESFKIKHKIECELQGKCVLCSDFANYQGNYECINMQNKKTLLTLITIYKTVKKREKESKRKKERAKQYQILKIDNIQKFYNNILELLLIHLNNHSYKLIFSYKTIIKNSPRYLLRNIEIVVDAILRENTQKMIDNNYSIFNEIFLFFNFNIKLRKTLKDFDEFVSLPNELKKYSKFFYLSQSLKELQNQLMLTTAKIDKKQDSSTFQDECNKNYVNFYKYNLNINRYIIESLFNKQISSLPQIDIEGQDDYLLVHYLSDKFLLLGIQTDNTLNIHRPEITIIKSTKEFIPFFNTKLDTIFHRPFMKTGIDNFIIQLSSIKEENGFFEFVYKKENNENKYDFFSYTFKVLPRLISNHIIIYGYYKCEMTKFIIFSEEANESTLYALSPHLEKMFGLDNEWIKILTNSNCALKMEDMFKAILKEDKKIKCKFDYLSYFNVIKNYRKMLFDYFELNHYQQKTIKRANSFFEKMNQKMAISMNVVLRHKLTIKSSYHTEYKVYEFFLENSKKMKLSGTNINGKINETLLAPSSGDNSSEKIKQELQTLVTHSTSSVSSPGKISSSLTKNRSLLNYLSDGSSYSSIKNDKLLQIKKTFFIFAIIILILNISIIIISVIFLIIQIQNTNNLTKINILYFQYKRIRILFANSFLSVITNFCPCETLECISCSSGFKAYSERIINQYSLSPDQNLRKYIIAELKVKSHLLQSLFEEYKSSLYSYNNKVLLSSLDEKMKYAYITISNDEISYEKKEISMDEGLKIFTNALVDLANSSPSYDQYKIFLLNMKDGEYSFDNVKKDMIPLINPVQRNIYSIIINYINYYSGYINGENLIYDAFYYLQNRTKNVMIIFMVLFCGLNIILGIICAFYIVLVRKMFISFIIKMHETLKNESFISYFRDKMKNLMTISRLYEKNPNSVIKTMKKSKAELFKKLREHKRKSIAMHQPITPLIKTNFFSQEQSLSSAIISTNNDTYKIANPFYFNIIRVFSLYVVLTLSIDFALLIVYHQYTLTNDYGIECAKMENQIFNNIVIADLSTLINITQEETAILFNDSIEEDGYINSKVRLANSQLHLIRAMERQHSTLIKEMSSYYDYNCDNLFQSLSDTIYSGLVELNKVEYYDMLSTLCKHYKILSLPNFDYLFNQMNFKTQELMSSLTDFSYDNLVRFNTSDEFYDLVTIILVLFRIIQNYFRLGPLINNVIKSINLFIGLMWTYLSYNIVSNCVMFLLIRKLIINRLNVINNNLNLLDNCFNFS